jgi:acetylglutamate synthase
MKITSSELSWRAMSSFATLAFSVLVCMPAQAGGCAAKSINARTQSYSVKRDSNNIYNFLTIRFVVTDACPDDDDNEIIGISIRLTGTNDAGEAAHEFYTLWEDIQPRHSHQKVVGEDDTLIGLETVSNVEVARVEVRR